MPTDIEILSGFVIGFYIYLIIKKAALNKENEAA